MGKNVLILSGSPRRGGNSDLLCDEFGRGAKEAGNTVEKIFVRDKKIGFCTGCFAAAAAARGAAFLGCLAPCGFAPPCAVGAAGAAWGADTA